ncbi:hypothetical protein NPIL_630901 [Nephila pilipes]|uniref:Uncharacterized protein n=1 Tax=Nephila pilipes TaxID=299642 RepID=A0A8X6Q6G3_NEPPI|nr:hypothetical protein NPIL_630901 [Nephila pilipes]
MNCPIEITSVILSAICGKLLNFSLIWGENFRELVPIYFKLIEVHCRLGDSSTVSVYEKELKRMAQIHGIVPSIADEEKFKEIIRILMFEKFMMSGRF